MKYESKCFSSATLQVFLLIHLRTTRLCLPFDRTVHVDASTKTSNPTIKLLVFFFIRFDWLNTKLPEKAAFRRRFRQFVQKTIGCGDKNLSRKLNFFWLLGYLATWIRFQWKIVGFCCRPWNLIFQKNFHCFPKVFMFFTWIVKIFNKKLETWPHFCSRRR